MSENILYKFAKDLSQLYAKTLLKEVEKCFVKVAQSLDSEVEKWLTKAVQLNYKASLQKPIVLDTLILLTRIKNSYPSGISRPEFLKVFINDASMKAFLPTIVSLRDISDSGDYAILSPYKSIFDSSRNMTYASAETGAVTHDVQTLDGLFRNDLNNKINKAYEDDVAGSRKSISKKEKTGLLLNYLIRRFSEEISIAYEEIGQIDPLGLVDDSSILRDPQKILTMYPQYPKLNIPIIVDMAKKIVKDIANYNEPQYYDYVYNYIRNKIMLYAYSISKEQFEEFMYQSSLGMHMKENVHDVSDTPKGLKPIDVDPASWKRDQSLIMLSCVLFVLGTKAR